MKQQIYRQLIEDCPIAYAHINVEWDTKNICNKFVVIDVNRSLESVLGIKKEEIINLDIKEHFGKKSGREILDLIKSSVNNKQVKRIYLEESNKYVNIEVHNVEKHEYHVMLTKISNDSNKLSSILKNSPFIAWIKNRDGKYIDINNKYLELLNMKYEDVIGKSDRALWCDKVSDQFEHQDRYVFIENKLCLYDEVLDMGDSKTHYFQTAKWPYTDISGSTILGTMGISIEVTDKLTLKSAMEKNERNFLDIANNIQDLIVIRDEKKALYVSPYFEKLYGFKPDKLYEDITEWYKYWDKIEYTKKPKDYSYKGISSDIFRVVKEGKVDKWIHSKFVPMFDENGDIVKKVGILNDITDKKKLEEELDNLRMEFFTNLSHELRTPINLMTSSLQVINKRVEKLEKEDSEYLNKYLSILSQNSLRLLKLVNNLIDTTKIDSGTFDYSPKNQDIISFVEDICMSVCDFVKLNNLKIIFDTDTEEKIIGFDLDYMERIILNLISNAIKFNKDNGKIEVTISTKDKINISVKDSGIGIPEEKIESVFGRFEQVNKKMRREREGSGIGLSLVKSLVEMQGGEISLNSEVGKGSEFIITLPDILVCEESSQEPDKIPIYSDKVNKMEVEFSDIYI